MYIRSTKAILMTAMLSACNTVNIPIEKAKSVTINSPADVRIPQEKPSKASEKKSKDSFKYLSKLTITKGPCPGRDPSTYGLLMKQRTTIVNGNIICYYN